MKFGSFSRPELIAHAVREQAEGELKSLNAENRALILSIGNDDGNSADSFYHNVLDSTADAILVVDDQGVIDWVNRAACEIFGYAKSEMTGKHQSSLIPERFRKTHEQNIRAYFENPSKRTMAEHSTTFARHKSGDDVPIAATLSPLELAGKNYVVCVVRPLSPVAALSIAKQEAAV
jgi:PAS domain S-box-containing protein